MGVPLGDAASLIANNSSRPAGLTPDEEPNYKDEHCLAFAKWTIPILWLSPFVGTDLKTFESIDGDCLGPVTSLASARSNWLRRRPLLEERFLHDKNVFDQWEQAIGRLKTRYIKVDVTELWLMAEEDEQEEFETDLRGGVRWFETGSDGDFLHLLALLWRQDAYDSVAKAFKEKDDVPFMFYGNPLRLPSLESVEQEN